LLGQKAPFLWGNFMICNSENRFLRVIFLESQVKIY
jgi:hypothetical protein